MLEATGIHKRLAGRDVLSGVDLRCGPSDVAVVMGGNGAGKSTLLRIVAGLLEPDRGAVVLCGDPVHGGGVAARRRLGYAPDATEALPDLQVCELVALVAALKQAPPLDRAWVERIGAGSFFRQRLSGLSFGQRKRALLLAALVGDPWLLVLDEPTNGLDEGGARVVLDLIAERRAGGKATLLTTNDPALASALGDRPRWLGAGRLGAAGVAPRGGSADGAVPARGAGDP
ncbi:MULTISPECIES: ATP-binding cassette domain-containing protein [Sorangium]|uniref:ABC transporter ATP-binding protein n=1 Tax=Sorangium cellulosum TaxID=56 RepID=A0A4P2QR89_SORCE|nr:MULTISPECIES: ABC transporter ATP-binding protein [Sorangium]AUX32548.1 ABC transporter ATP-binding protein [Sorangium cellulosum]WCQ91922.1 Lipoprotein-releasing system ATP-binding protein LolD [Sorangium sp. Soce836]